MMYIIAFVRRSTHITVNFLYDLHDIPGIYAVNYEYTFFFLDFFPGKCRSMKIPRLENTISEKKIFFILKKIGFLLE